MDEIAPLDIVEHNRIFIVPRARHQVGWHWSGRDLTSDLTLGRCGNRRLGVHPRFPPLPHDGEPEYKQQDRDDNK